VERSEVGAVFSVTAELARAFARKSRNVFAFIALPSRLTGVSSYSRTRERAKARLAVKLASYAFEIRR